MEKVAILTRGLTKYYGRKRGVEDLDLRVERGEVFGFLGPNGAGKTTTIRLLLDLIRPTRGKAEVLGMDARVRGVEIRKRLGYLPGDLALYDNLTGEELLRYLAGLRGGADWGYVRYLAERLQCDLTLRIKSLSRGNKQKIGIVQAFMHRPELLIMDEPTNGLDPLMQHEFHRLVRETSEAGATFFISSHNLPEVERMCDRVGIIREGRLVAVDEVEALKRKALRRLEIHFASPVPPGDFAAIPGVKDLRVEDRTLTCSLTGSVDALIKAAARFEVLNVVSPEVGLEEIFMHYYREGSGGEGGGADA
ncbi:ABC transporter ATP-binding protein [Candidatus Solincola tengchongensis]|uniref:ABC transporter ATP-binding protein n=1 Tax=Candidatus Solincola tengchongensis TaxID=2900693 RepID=UPI00257B99EE|nr:ABC transporter ATP-binding protein [Candidatus Solincola tengchongensis]